MGFFSSNGINLEDISRILLGTFPKVLPYFFKFNLFEDKDQASNYYLYILLHMVS